MTHGISIIMFARCPSVTQCTRWSALGHLSVGVAG